MNSATIVQKIWNYCNILRDDGLSYVGVSEVAHALAVVHAELILILTRFAMATGV